MRARLQRAILGGLLAALAAALLGAAPASAASPWWHLSSGARPTVLQPGLGGDEIQSITVAATGGLVVVVEPISLEEEEKGKGEVKFATFEPTATHEEVQAALEGLYGEGNVTVTGGPGDATGSRPYVVTFGGALANRPVRPMNTTAFAFLLEGEAKTAELREGRPDGRIVVTASNLGDAAVDGAGSKVTISDKLPAGMHAVGIEAIAGNTSVSHGPVTCSVETVTCTYSGTLPAYDQIEVDILIGLEGASSGELNEATVTGGGAPSQTVRRPITVGAGPTPFGIEDYELAAEEAGGATDTLAGSHPFQLTTTLTLNQTADAQPAALPKDATFKWPAGLLGNPTLVPRCTLGQFLRFKGQEFVNACPQQTAVGVAMLTLNEPAGNLGTPGADEISTPIFNLEPAPGEPARFGFLAPGTPVVIDTSVRTGDDYGVTVRTSNISQTAAFLSAEVVVWGVPGDARHDGVRGNGCLRDDAEGESLPCHPLEEQRPPAFLAMPTACAPEALASSVQADSWSEPGVLREPSEDAFIGPFSGCNRLPFSPSLQIATGTHAASSPTALSTDLHVPQAQSSNPVGVVPSAVREITVQLPEGLQLNPSAAGGLAACSEAQIGYTGADASGVQHFTPADPACPDASKIGKVTLRTPLLTHSLDGFVYLAAPQNFSAPPQENPFESLVAMYVAAKDPESGVLVKLAGSVALSEAGQITASFPGTPQVPFEDAEVEFFGGSRASVSTPARCGGYPAAASFAPWSAAETVLADSAFQVESGVNGGPCPSAQPFAPTLAAGTANPAGGAFTSLTTSVSREDGERDMQSVELHTPPGLSGVLTGVPLCTEAQANAGTCAAGSLIGDTTVSVGVGESPFTVTGGQVFLTEGFQGAPFGLSIVTPAKAGPFDLGNVIVRAQIEVDPHTAALTIRTGAIPHVLRGIPLHIKHVNVTIDRPGFTFNPTSCSPTTIAGSVASVEGASALVSTAFQPVNCATLAFAPKFSASTSGKTSKANGASLTTKLVYPTAAQGTQANIAKVKVELPKQLPSRLTTLQKACTSAQFEANYVGCPAASIVGHAVVRTPVLPVPLTGPAYFVSHGGEAFPSLTMVLQGYGVTIDLVGTTSIKKGITSTTFNSVPDVPFSSFELTLPQSKFSALAANGDLCASKLAMPTEFIAQNGIPIYQSTPIAVTGCKKPPTRAQKLASALKACKKKRNKGKRAQCERQARKRFGPVKRKATGKKK